MSIRLLGALLSTGGGEQSIRDREEGTYLDHSLKVIQLTPSYVLLRHATSQSTFASQVDLHDGGKLSSQTM